MIDYQTYCRIRQLYTEQKLGFRQIARELKVDLKTVRKWARRESFQKAPLPKRESKLDSFKGEIVRLLERHDYSARQLFQQIKERGYNGRYTIVKDFVRQVRPKPKPAFLTLHFEPGECAQATKTIKSRGFEQKAIPLKTLFPILKGCELEEDEDMIERWVNLLASACVGDPWVRSFSRTLDEISPLEARILDAICKLEGPIGNLQDMEFRGVAVGTVRRSIGQAGQYFEQGLANLQRLTLVEERFASMTFIANTVPRAEKDTDFVGPSLYGAQFFERCTRGPTPVVSKDSNAGKAL